MARQQGRHRFLGTMSVLIFLLLLVNLVLPLLPAPWRAVLVPQDNSGDVAQSETGERQPFGQDGPQADPGVAPGAAAQGSLSPPGAPGLPVFREEAPGVTAEDLQLLEERLADRFVTVEKLEEELYRDALGRLASRKERAGQAAHLTVVVPVPPSRPLPHPLPGRQF